jgi:hypothetical protein
VDKNRTKLKAHLTAFLILSEIQFSMSTSGPYGSRDITYTPATNRSACVRYTREQSVADPGSGAFLTPGSGMGKNIKIRIRYVQPGSYFRELATATIFGVKNTYSLMRIRNIFVPGSGMEKFGSGINIPDPQHRLRVF